MLPAGRIEAGKPEASAVLRPKKIQYIESPLAGATDIVRVVPVAVKAFPPPDSCITLLITNIMSTPEFTLKFKLKDVVDPSGVKV
jgi:hypothetical protein